MDTTGKFANFFKASEEFSDKERYAKHKQEKSKGLPKGFNFWNWSGICVQEGKLASKKAGISGQGKLEELELERCVRANLKQR